MTRIINRSLRNLFKTRAVDVLPHTVSHQRIYIVPTKRGGAFLLVILLMLIAAINYALSLGYALCFLLTGLFAATLLHTYKNIAGVQVQDIQGKEAFAGEPLVFRISLANHATQPRHGIRISSREHVSTHTRIMAESTAQIALIIPTDSRGIEHLGRLTLQSDWPLGLWTCWSYVHVPVSGVIYPLAECNPPPLPTTLDESADGQPIAGTQGDVSGLREYIPGDAIGSIAWKSAARGIALQVRTFDADNLPADALLSLQRTGKINLEEQLSRLCAWVLYAESMHTDYALQLPGQQLDYNHGSEHRQRVLTALATHGKHL